MLMYIYLLCFQIVLSFHKIKAQDFASFGILFSSCQRFTPQFDDCIKDAINSARPFFTTGVPEYHLPPADPWYAEEVNQNRLGYKLKLKNVREAGWQQSSITKFRANFEAGYVKFSQFFPEKYLEGEYISDAGGINKGVWNMTLYNYTQTMTIRKSKTDPLKLKVKVNIDKIGNLNMHISNLLRGRKRVESVLDVLINSTWRMGFPLLKPLIEDLVETAFSKIYSEVFGNYDWNLLLPPSIMSGQTPSSHYILISSTWRMGFPLLKPLNEYLVETAFSKVIQFPLAHNFYSLGGDVFLPPYVKKNI